MKSGRLSHREAVSAGGVVYRRSDLGIEVVLVARIATELWSLPKGTPEPGESLEETARREVQEETGLHVEIVCPISEIRYSYVIRSESIYVAKVVHYYLMEPLGGDVSEHDEEYDLAVWIEVQEAMNRLTHDNDRDVLRRALELLQPASEQVKVDGDAGL